jgi:hypothetical protein
MRRIRLFLLTGITGVVVCGVLDLSAPGVTWVREDLFLIPPFTPPPLLTQRIVPANDRAQCATTYAERLDCSAN